MTAKTCHEMHVQLKTWTMNLTNWNHTLLKEHMSSYDKNYLLLITFQKELWYDDKTKIAYCLYHDSICVLA